MLVANLEPLQLGLEFEQVAGGGAAEAELDEQRQADAVVLVRRRAVELNAQHAAELRQQLVVSVFHLDDFPQQASRRAVDVEVSKVDNNRRQAVLCFAAGMTHHVILFTVDHLVKYILANYAFVRYYVRQQGSVLQLCVGLVVVDGQSDDRQDISAAQVELADLLL